MARVETNSIVELTQLIKTADFSSFGEHDAELDAVVDQLARSSDLTPAEAREAIEDWQIGLAQPTWLGQAA